MNNNKIKNLKDLKNAFKNNCFGVYLNNSHGVNVKVTHSKIVNGILKVKSANGWLNTNYGNLYIA